jgi:DNA-binding helix-hairpin-helix protein with protein kinase domain
MDDLNNVTVLVTCPECGRPSQGPVTGEVVTTEGTAQVVPIDSLEVRDALIVSLLHQASRLSFGQPIPESLTERIRELRIEHEKLIQADL